LNDQFASDSTCGAEISLSSILGPGSR